MSLDWEAEIKGEQPQPEPKPDIEPVVKRLAALGLGEYDRERVEEAKRLGVRASTLDMLVEAERDAGGAGEVHRPSVVEDVEPWPDAVSWLNVAEEIRGELFSYIKLPSDGDADALTLWILGSFLLTHFHLWPKVLIRSPKKRCGKTDLMRVLEAFAYRALLSVYPTPAVIFRAVDKWGVTLLLDEADRWLPGNEEMIGIVNCGHTRRTARVLRVIDTPSGHEPASFSVWAPMAIAGIGGQSDTIVDRSICIDLKRKLTSEKTARMTADYYERRHDVRRKLLRWAEDNGKRAGDLDVEPPDCGNDRARDNWTPLHRIAAILGDPWPERVGTAYLAKETDRDDDDDSAGVMLLNDLVEIFDDNEADRLQTVDIVTDLIAMEDRPWCEWRNGKPISARSVAGLLKPFRVKRQTLRFGSTTGKGYARAPIQAACDRYSSRSTGSVSVTRKQSNDINVLPSSQTATSPSDVTDKKGAKPLKEKESYRVTDRNPAALSNDALEECMADFEAMNDPTDERAWMGVRPSQADRSRPHWNCLASPSVATMADAVIGPMPGIV